MSTKAFIAAVAASLILAIAISGTAVYYNGVVDEKNSKINSLSNQVAILREEVTNLTAQAANLDALQANLTATNNTVANLTNQNIDFSYQIQNLKGQAEDLESQVENLSSQIAILTTANIVTALGISEIPTTYQLAVGASPQYLSAPYDHLYIEGSVTNNGTGTAYNAGLHVEAYGANGVLEVNMTVPLVSQAQFGADASTRSYANQNADSLKLTTLGGTSSAIININIFHEGIASNWTVSPVWTNFP